MRHLLAIAALVASQALADEALIISFEHKSKLENAFESDDYQELVVQINGLEITCRSYAMGGGTLYISNNPLQFVAGRTLDAEIWKDRELRVTVPDRNRPLRFNILSAKAIE